MTLRIICYDKLRMYSRFAVTALLPRGGPGAPGPDPGSLRLDPAVPCHRAMGRPTRISCRIMGVVHIYGS